jgi:hypothetical protein
MSSKKNGGMQEGPLVKMLELERVQKAEAEDAARAAAVMMPFICSCRNNK